MGLTKLDKAKLDFYKTVEGMGGLTLVSVNEYDGSKKQKDQFSGYQTFLPKNLIAPIEKDFADYMSYNLGYNNFYGTIRSPEKDKGIEITRSRVESTDNPSRARERIEEYLESFDMELDGSSDALTFKNSISILRNIKGDEYIVDILRETARILQTDKDYRKYSQKDSKCAMVHHLYYDSIGNLMTNGEVVLPKYLVQLMKEFNIDLGEMEDVTLEYKELDKNLINELYRVIKDDIKILSKERVMPDVLYEKFINRVCDLKGVTESELKYIPTKNGKDKQLMTKFIKELCELVDLDDSLKYLYIGNKNELLVLVESLQYQIKDRLQKIESERLSQVKSDLKDAFLTKGLDSFINELVDYIESK